MFPTGTSLLLLADRIVARAKTKHNLFPTTPVRSFYKINQEHASIKYRGMFLLISGNKKYHRFFAKNVLIIDLNLDFN